MNKENQPVKSPVRIESFDVAKGLGVILVVLGHMWYKCPFPIINQLIYSFHMPLFFILSGFVFKKHNIGIVNFILSKSKRLLLPSFFFLLLGAIVLFLQRIEYTEILRKFLFIDGMCPYNDPVWYFITLFQLCLISFFLNLDKLSPLFKVIVMTVSLVAGLIIYQLEIYIPFGINRTIIAMVFFAFGSFLGQINRECKLTIKKHTHIGIFAACLILWFICAVLVNNHKISFYSLNLGNYFSFIIAGICGSVLFVGLCKLLCYTSSIKAFLKKTASNSIIIVGTHYFVRSTFEHFMARFGLFETWIYALIAICFALSLVAIYNLLGPFAKKYFPAITGDLKSSK